MNKTLLTLSLVLSCCLLQFGAIAQTAIGRGHTNVGHGHEEIKTEMNFTDLANYYLAHPEPLVIQEPENDEDDNEKPHHPPMLDRSLIHYRARTSASTHGRGLHTPSAPPSLPISPSPTDTFESIIDPGTVIPPDTHGAVDSNYCVTTINSNVRIQTRVGATVSTVSLNAFWAPIVGSGCYDPRIHYDLTINRWIFVTDWGAQSTTSSLLIGISKTSNPTGGWWMYKVLADATGVNWLDYPNVGFNGKWITITGNMFTVAANAYSYAKVFVFNKANLVSGVGASYTSFTQAMSFTIAPALTYDVTEQNMFMVESWDGTAAAGGQMELWKISGAVGSETMTSVGFPASAGFRWQGQSNAVSGSAGADFVPQLGTASLIQANDDRVTQLVQMNNTLWFAHPVFLPFSTTTNPTRTSIQWWQIDTLGAPIQIALIDDPSATNNNFYTFPTLSVNTNNDALIGFSITSKLIHPSTAYALHMHTDPVDSTRPVFTYRHGLNTYFKNFGGSRDRWGDYSATVLDPLTGIDFWTLQECSASGANTWDTWWAYIKICVPPVATITPAGATTVCSPATVVLNANTGTGLTYQWEVGGSAIAGATNAVYTATVTGTYNVIVYNSATCDSVSLPVTVSVNAAPAVITGNAPVCTGATLNLTDATAGGTWSSTVTSVATVSSAGVVTGVAAGTSTISYTLSTGCASTVVVTVNTSPTATITPGGPTTFCTGGSVILSASTGAGYTYQWQVGGGNIGGATNSTYTATTGGNYTVIISNTGCNATSAITTVTVGTPPGATITPAGPTTFCTGGSVVLNANTGAGYTYQWQLGGSNIGGATNSSYTASLGGNYTVIVSNGGCNNTSAITTVTVTVGPGATITPAGPTTFCVGGSVVLNANTGAGITYQWQLGGSNIPGATLSSYTASTGGNYTVIVSLGACVVTSAITTVTVNTPPVVTAIGGATNNVCTGQTVTLTDANTGGAWSSGNTAIATISTAGVVTGVSAGTASISYTLTNACGSTNAVTTVTVNSATAVLPISGVLNVCVGGTSALSDATALGVWSSVTPAIATITSGGVVTGVATGTDVISYTVTNGAGCVSSATATVNVSTAVTAVITPASATTFCTGGFVVLNATTGAGYSYQWQLSGSNITGATSSSYTASTGGNYTVIINEPGGCTVTSAGVLVTVSAALIVVPSVSITGDLGTILCATGALETFSVTPVNGGTAPAYQWYVNGVAVGAGGATYAYTPANGDVVKCVMTSNALCAFPDTAVNSLTMAISPLQTPSVSITSIHNDSTCTGDTVQFAAIPVFGGTAPTYLWTENGINVATGPYYVYTPMDGDTLIVTMTSNYPCLSTPIAVSSMFIIHVFPPVTNSLSVSVSQSTIQSGRVDTFTATAVGAGSSPSFQWYINGNPVAGATSYRYITDSLQDGQIISCMETSSFVCSDPMWIMSGGISIHVVPNGVQQVNNTASHFTILPNPNKGTFAVNGTLGTVGDDRVTIVMSDLLGQTILNKTVVASNGNINEQITLDNSLPNGNYIVTITSGRDHVVFHVTVDR